ncbi:hypothetical protein A2U01_0079211, partial [Trifolium medium]|nr:hypothetical protein [Trifolium medium]
IVTAKPSQSRAHPSCGFGSRRGSVLDAAVAGKSDRPSCSYCLALEHVTDAVVTGELRVATPILELVSPAGTV